MFKGIILYKCKRNINRCIRLCYTFGVPELYLLNCNVPDKFGNLFSAKDKVKIIEINDLTNFDGNVIALEKGGKEPIEKLKQYDYLLLGGENQTITHKMCKNRIEISTVNDLCLTVDEALAVGLYAKKDNCD